MIIGQKQKVDDEETDTEPEYNYVPGCQGKKKAVGALGKTELWAFFWWIVTSLLYVIFLIWAFVPEKILNEYGWNYIPDKLWALRIMTAACCVVVLMAQIFYFGKCIFKTIPKESFLTI